MLRCRTQNRGHNARRGAVLALTVVLMLLLSISSMTAIQVGHAARMRSLDNRDHVAARYAADAGLSRAVYLMNQSVAQSVWYGVSIPSFNAEPLPGTDATYSVSVRGSLATEYIITSTGRAGQAERTLGATVRLTNPFGAGYAIFSQTSIDLPARTTIGGFDSANPSLQGLHGNLGTTSDKPGAIDIKNRTEVHGDIYITPTGDPDAVVSIHNHGRVHGEIFQNPFTPPMPSVRTPWLWYRGNIRGADRTLTALDSGVYGTIDLFANGTLTVRGHCVLIINGDIDLANRATIHLEPLSSLRIYLNGNLNAQNADGVRNDSGDPSRFKLYGTGSGQTFHLKNSTNFYGAIYAPNADMHLDNSADVYGAFIVNRFDLKKNATVNYDNAMSRVDFTDELLRFEIVRWEEL